MDKICKKVGEESAEVIIAAKNRVHDEVQYETADLIYHLLVLLTEQEVPGGYLGGAGEAPLTAARVVLPARLAPDPGG